MGQVESIALLLSLIWLGGVSYFIWKLGWRYKRLTQGTAEGTLPEVLEGLIREVTQQKEAMAALVEKVNHTDREGMHHVRNIHVMRFNPFSDTGGDQSFILTALDAHGTGIVLTSLHNRGVTRWYAKNITEGKGVGYDLSNDEKKAIHEAVLARRDKNKTV